MQPLSTYVVRGFAFIKGMNGYFLFGYISLLSHTKELKIEF